MAGRGGTPRQEERSGGHRCQDDLIPRQGATPVRAAWMTRLKIGPATVAPEVFVVWSGTRTATATLGFVYGAKPIIQSSTLASDVPIWAVPVFTATWAFGVNPTRCAVPSGVVTTRCISVLTFFAAA